MKKIICRIEDFKNVCEKFKAEVRTGVNNSELNFYSKDGDMILYHSKLVTPGNAMMATIEPINYKLE